MQYPHERDEQKQLLNQLIDRAASYRSLLASIALLVGSIILTSGLIQSLVAGDSQGSNSWTISWLVTFGLSLGATLTTLFLFNKKAGIHFLNKRQLLVSKNIVPALLAGVIMGSLISLGDSSRLPYSAALWVTFTGVALTSVIAYSMSAVKNLALAQLVIGLSFVAVLARHQDLAISPHHIANIILIIGLGLSNVIFGLWLLLIKK